MFYRILNPASVKPWELGLPSASSRECSGFFPRKGANQGEACGWHDAARRTLLMSNKPGTKQCTEILTLPPWETWPSFSPSVIFINAHFYVNALKAFLYIRVHFPYLQLNCSLLLGFFGIIVKRMLPANIYYKLYILNIYYIYKCLCPCLDWNVFPIDGIKQGHICYLVYLYRGHLR